METEVANRAYRPANLSPLDNDPYMATYTVALKVNELIDRLVNPQI